MANAVANVALNNDNKVVSFGNNFVRPSKYLPVSLGTCSLTFVSESVPSTEPSVSIQSAISIAERTLLATHNDHPPSLEFFAKQDGTLALTHVVQVQNDDHWFEAFVDAHTGEIVNVIDFVAHASVSLILSPSISLESIIYQYRVIPLQQQSLLDGGFQTLTNPQDTFSSPFGWHSDGTSTINTTTTAGNNAISFKSSQTAVTSESSAGLNFVFTFNATAAPSVSPNVDVARTNAFYVVNSIHVGSKSSLFDAKES